MKTISINLYQFEELPEDVQDVVVREYWDINVDYEWWDYVYEDAWAVNIKIEEFNLDYKNEIEGTIMFSAVDTARSVLENHGPTTETYQLAEQYMRSLEKVEEGITDEDEREDSLYDLDNEFEKSLLRCYWKMLYDEYEYRLSRDAVVDTLVANEYDFTIEGRIY